MAKTASVKNIESALARGQLSIKDPKTGYYYTFHARCPKDKSLSPVYRVNKANAVITQLIFRCPVCQAQFEAAPADMVLK